MKRLRVLLGLLLVVGLVCAGLVTMLLAQLHPERAAPELARAPASARVVRDVAADVVPTSGVRIHGTVVTTEGEPVAGAAVSARGVETTTEADGSYTLWARPERGTIWASAFGFAADSVPYDGAGDHPDGIEVNLVLEPRHDLRVWCAGLPDDDCGEFRFQCTTPWSPVGTPCFRDDDLGETICICPEGEVAVRGGGRAVLVDAEADEAWLDFRDTGRIVGRVLVSDGTPEGCWVEGVRIPTALEDLPRGLVVGRRATCEPDGRFVLLGLVPGDWQVVAKVESEAGRLERTLIPRAVRLREVVDVGDVPLPGGGGIEGTVVDGLTGQPVSDAPVLAWREATGSTERITLAADESADGSGAFAFQGLPPGTWNVSHVLAPHDGVTVTVTEGGVTRGIRIATSDATALDENGFALAEDDGALVVQDVTPGGPADEAGLEPGEVVVGALVGGFDVTSALGEHGGEFTRALLGHWDGPGVTLVVRNPDGEEEEVPLEW